MWNITDKGETIGTSGSESGEIVVDLEHSKGARLTLEKECVVAPYSITSGVYGSFFHTTYLSTFEKGMEEINIMKKEISDFLETETTNEEDHDWITSFVDRH